MVSLWLLLTTVQACPTYVCTSLAKDVCMQWSSQQVSLNSLGCQDASKTCSISQALAAYQANTTAGSYACQAVVTESTLEQFEYCGEREESSRYLAYGANPKNCSVAGYSDSACLLNDGSYAECRCGMDSNLYCQPNPSDIPFGYYWSVCEDQDYIVAVDFFEYYYLLNSLYVEYYSKPSCASTLFEEFAALGQPLPQADYNSALLLSLLWLCNV